ncbi:hypothetical protein VTJ83DRAFT_3747 [Remersonia thermophila]|uniref:TauD/TfdA-like domain-containing protein n=1 Tax=Remersonia thermophila TaxID=72144 RepID=A0ABR4DF08_9PEZI
MGPGAAIRSHPMGWLPTELVRSGGPLVVDLTERDVAEVEAALEACKLAEVDPDAVSRATFPLPTLATQLERASHQVHQGQGFAIVRGPNPQNYTAEDNVIIFLGISSYLGEQRGVQDKKGSMLTHVTDSKIWTAPPEMRHGIHTTTGLAWHCDMGTEVLALHVRSKAHAGGDTYVASAWTIYKELMASYPDVLEQLCDPSWPIQVSVNPPKYFVAPLMHISDKVLISVDPGRLGLHPATAAVDGGFPVPALTRRQRMALEVLSELATKFRHRLDLQQGDMVFINNLALLHARDPYVDSETGPGRHVVRLWLRNPHLAWNIPLAMRAPWEAAFGGDGLRAMKRSYPALPNPVYKPPRYTAGSAAFILDDSEDVNSSGSV